MQQSTAAKYQLKQKHLVLFQILFILFGVYLYAVQSPWRHLVYLMLLNRYVLPYCYAKIVTFLVSSLTPFKVSIREIYLFSKLFKLVEINNIEVKMQKKQFSITLSIESISLETDFTKSIFSIYNSSTFLLEVKSIHTSFVINNKTYNMDSIKSVQNQIPSSHNDSNIDIQFLQQVDKVYKKGISSHRLFYSSQCNLYKALAFISSDCYQYSSMYVLHWR